MRCIFLEDDTGAILIVDATNASYREVHIKYKFIWGKESDGWLRNELLPTGG